MTTCPHCKEQIEDGAKKCPHCGLWVTTLRRIGVGVKIVIEFLTFIAAIAVLGIMVWHSFIMKKSLEVSEQALLQMDSTFTLTTTQIGLQEKEYDVLRNELDLMRSTYEVQMGQYEVSRKESLERNRPRIVIHPPKVTVTDSCLILYTNVENKGSSDADEVLVLVRCKFPQQGEGSPKYYEHLFDIGKITINYTNNLPFAIPIFDRDLYSMVDLRYEWLLYQEYYGDCKYFIHQYNKDSVTFDSKKLELDEAKQIFK